MGYIDKLGAFQVGDVIKRPGPWGTDHVGLLAGVDGFGQLCVIHNAKQECVKWDLLSTFAAGQPVTLVRRAANPAEGVAIVSRAMTMLGRRFDLLNFNCEHFVTCAIAGEAASPQLRLAMLGFCALAAIGLWAQPSA